MGIGLTSAVMAYDETFVFIALLPPNKLMGGRKRGGAGRLQGSGSSAAVQSERHWYFSLSPYFLLGYFHMGLPETSLSCSYFLVGEQHLFGEARACLGGVAAHVRLSHSPDT